MKNSLDTFYGQQEGESILYALKPHPISVKISLLKLYAGSLALWVSGFIIKTQLPTLAGFAGTVGFFGAILIAILGTMAILSMEHSDISYITNRRIIRFHAHNPFATSTRTLSWDQAAKVKTFPPNLLYKMFMIGSVVIHSKTTIVNSDIPKTQNTVSNDDIELTDVYYYKDLGNYIDKIIYLYNREPEELKNLRAFVPKPKGKRY